MLELAAARLRSGGGWDEGTTCDVLREILHLYPRAREEGARAGAAVGEILKEGLIPEEPLFASDFTRVRPSRTAPTDP